MAYTIRPMTSADVPAVFAIDRASQALYWPEKSYIYTVEENQNARPFVSINDEGTVTGFIVMWLILDTAEVANFAVDAAYRGKGIGRALLLTGLRACYEGGAMKCELEVRAGNVPAKSLYRAAGFREVGLRKGYYQDNHEDAILMDLDSPDYQKRMDEVRNE